jgi:hypothetical protein
VRTCYGTAGGSSPNQHPRRLGRGKDHARSRARGAARDPSLRRGRVLPPADRSAVPVPADARGSMCPPRGRSCRPRQLDPRGRSGNVGTGSRPALHAPSLCLPSLRAADSTASPARADAVRRTRSSRWRHARRSPRVHGMDRGVRREHLRRDQHARVPRAASSTCRLSGSPVDRTVGEDEAIARVLDRIRADEGP